LVLKIKGNKPFGLFPFIKISIEILILKAFTMRFAIGRSGASAAY